MLLFLIRYQKYAPEKNVTSLILKLKKINIVYCLLFVFGLLFLFS